MNEYRVYIKVRNNLILEKIEALGYASPYEFCNSVKGISYHTLTRFLNMKEPIFDHKGRIRPVIYRLCDILKCSPEELFTASQMEASLETNKKTLKIKEAEVLYMLNNQSEEKLLEEIVEEDQRDKAIDECLNGLTPRERDIVEMRLGMGVYTKQHTFTEIAEKYGVTGHRISQIEQKALRKLRHPKLAEKLKEFI